MPGVPDKPARPPTATGSAPPLATVTRSPAPTTDRTSDRTPDQAPARRPLRTSPAFKAVVLALGLAGLWMLLSGLLKPVVLALGLFSVVLVVAIVARLGILDAEGVPLTVRYGRMLRYSGWLLLEILKADWAVARVILGRDMRLQQRLLRVPATTRTDLGKVVYANSITLTPGTVTVETEGETFLVHALTDDAADMDAFHAMNERVCGTEIVRGLPAGGSRRYGPASSMNRTGTARDLRRVR